MAYALRGTIGSPNTGSGSVSPTNGQTTAAGNLLIAWVTCDGADIADSAGSGYVRATNGGAAGLQAEIWYKANSSGLDSTPTFTGTGTLNARLAEFTGGATSSPLDQTGSNTGVGGNVVATAAAADAALGELVIGCSHIFYSMAATKTTTHAYNNGGTATQNVSNDATSTAMHYRWSYGITTGNASADTLTTTFTTTNATSSGFVVASFKLAGAASSGPNFSPQGQTGFFGA